MNGGIGHLVPDNPRVGFSRLLSVRPGLESRADRPATQLRRIRALWQLLQAQRPLIRHDIWLASGLVLALGWLVSVLLGRNGNTHGTLLVLVAPLIAALGLSLLYGPENDVALELALATPTSPVQVLLARFVLVFGYDTLVTLLFSLGFKLIMPAADLGHLLNLWLWPMLFLGTLALLLSLTIGTGAATLTSLVLWASLAFVITEPAGQFHATAALVWFWHAALPLGLLAAGCFAGSLLLSRRQEHFL